MGTKTIALAGRNEQHRLTPGWLERHPDVREIRQIEVTRLFHPSETAKMLSSDMVISMLPDGVATTLFLWLQEHDYQGFFLDTGVDFRLKDREDAIRYYRHEGFEEKIAADFRYVHPDLDGDLIDSSHLWYSLPGTISTLILPALKAILTSQQPVDLWITAILPNYVETESRIQAFQVFTYFETGEILARAAEWTDHVPKTNIVPVHMSVERGCWTTITLDQSDAAAMDQALDVFKASNPYVRRVFDLPTLGDVLQTNRLLIGYKRRGAKMVVGAAMDDQIKAGPGLVIPVMNRLFGLAPETGLE